MDGLERRPTLEQRRFEDAQCQVQVSASECK